MRLKRKEALFECPAAVPKYYRTRNDRPIQTEIIDVYFISDMANAFSRASVL